MKLTVFILLLTFINSESFACMSKEGQVVKKTEMTKFFSSQSKKVRKTASQDYNSFPSSFKANLESRLGNLLLEHKSSATLSLPAKILKSIYKPFGDGQSNAKLTMGDHWKEEGFPVVGVELLKADGSKERRYLFHSKLKVESYKEVKRTDGYYEVKPKGWNDAFYFRFDTGIHSVPDFLKGIPEKYRLFSQNRLAPDPAKVKDNYPYDVLRSKNLGEGYNVDPWYADNVHGRFPHPAGEVMSLGGVFTWGIVDQKFGPFKHLYTCFEARNLNKEKEQQKPSGAGWHFVGDAGETILNSLESAAIPVAIGRKLEAPVAYGLNDIITASWLPSDHVFVTVQGEFHWYLNPHEREICTEIWVHPCVPSMNNNWGFNCK